MNRHQSKQFSLRYQLMLMHARWILTSREVFQCTRWRILLLADISRLGISVHVFDKCRTHPNSDPWKHLVCWRNILRLNCTVLHSWRRSAELIDPFYLYRDCQRSKLPSRHCTTTRSMLLCTRNLTSLCQLAQRLTLRYWTRYWMYASWCQE